MSAALATTERGTGRAMIVADALTQEGEQRKLLGEYVAKHMQEDTDYGIIPGTKNRTLLKPGAEKLTTLFRCVPRFVVEEKIENWETGLFFYRFACHIETLDGGNVVAEGVGSCNSYEGRYRWRNADRKCPECGAAAIMRSKFPPRENPSLAPGWYCFSKKGGCGAQFTAEDEAITGQATGRVQNPDLADCANTVLKMAKKRAHVDAAIALARCSDIFTQDVEDFAGGHEEPEQPAARNGKYDPRTIPSVKSGADLKPPIRSINFSACGTLDELRALWVGLTPAEKEHYADAKDERKATLSHVPEGEQCADPSKAASGSAASANGSPASAATPSSPISRQTDSLPKAPKKLTANYISDLVAAVAETNGEDETDLIGALFASVMQDADSLDTASPDQLQRADKWLRERVMVAA